MDEPPSVGCLDTRHARRHFAPPQVLATHRALFMTSPHLAGAAQLLSPNILHGIWRAAEASALRGEQLLNGPFHAPAGPQRVQHKVPGSDHAGSLYPLAPLSVC